MSAVDLTVDHRIASTDAALRAWRGTSERRRLKWARQFASEQRDVAYRRRVLGVLGAALGATVVGSGAALWLYAPRSAPLAEVSQFAPPTQGSVPLVRAEAAVVMPAEAEPAAAVVAAAAAAPEAAPAFDGGVMIETVRVWTSSQTEWVQFDYTGSPLELRWLDAAGVEALDRMGCANIVSSDVRRCYVGRTQGRIDHALAGGAAAGPWTVQACAPGTTLCVDIGGFTTSIL